MRRLTSTADAWTAAATVGVLVLAAALPVSTLITFGFYPGGSYDSPVPRWQAVAAWLLVAVIVPIHLRHVWHGVRDELSPHGGPTFAAMVVAMVTGELILGHVWTFMAASLVASALLVFRPPWSVVWAGGVTLACYPLGTGVFGEGGWYVIVVVAYRSAVLFALVWLVAGVHRLREAARGPGAEGDRPRAGARRRRAAEHVARRPRAHRDRGALGSRHVRRR